VLQASPEAQKHGPILLGLTEQNRQKPNLPKLCACNVLVPNPICFTEVAVFKGKGRAKRDKWSHWTIFDDLNRYLRCINATALAGGFHLEGRKPAEYTFEAGIALASQNQPVQPSSVGSTDDLRIESWKQIAAFFDRDQRTVKRWEKTRNLPIRRLPGEKGGVFAYARELTEWLNSTPRADDAVVPPEVSSSPELAAVPLGTSDQGAGSAGERTELDPDGPGKHSRWLRIYGLAAVAITLVLCLLVLAVYIHGHTTANAGAPPRTPVRSSSAAQELYLQGRFAWNHRTAKSLKEAMDAFDQAIAKDPSFAPAYAGLADCYNLMPQYTGAPSSDVFPLAISAARKALALDSSLPEAHRALAFDLFYGEWDVNAAFREYRQAIDLDPGDAETHSWFATSLLLLGRTAEAKVEIARARELNPTSRSILSNQAFISYNDGDRSDGVEKLKALEAMEPDYLGPSGYLAQIFLWDRNYTGYLAEVKHMAQVSGETDQIALASAAEKGWNASGERGLLKQLRGVYLDAFRTGKSSGYEIALVDSRLGLHKEANQFFQAAVNARDYRMMSLLNGKFDAVMESDRDFLNIKQEIRSRMRL
jgi:Tfp pilus assembly protein PilF